MNFGSVPGAGRPAREPDYCAIGLFLGGLATAGGLVRDRARSEIATGYVGAVEATLHQLAKTPGLAGCTSGTADSLRIRSWRVQKPYSRHLVFYRFDDRTLRRADYPRRSRPARPASSITLQEQDKQKASTSTAGAMAMAMAMAISSSWPVLVVYQPSTMRKLRHPNPSSSWPTKESANSATKSPLSEDVLWSFAVVRTRLSVPPGGAGGLRRTRQSH